MMPFKKGLEQKLFQFQSFITAIDLVGCTAAGIMIL